MSGKPSWMGGKPSWVEENKAKPVPITAMSGFRRLLPEIVEVLGDKGLLVQAGLAHRHQQLTLADYVGHALKQRRNLVAQAGTGCGKSIGYCVPAILHAVGNNVKVVIATSNKLLQDQIVKGDLPMLQRILRPWLERHYKRTFRAEVLYGRDNYLCVKKFEKQRQLDGILSGGEGILQSWACQTRDGLLAESGLNFKSKTYLPLKVAYTANQDDCTGRKCDYFDQCYYYEARDRMENADILVVNHAVLVSHFRYGILPDFDAVIVDEAHNWEDNLISASTATISAERLHRIHAKAETILGTDSSAELVHRAGAFFAMLDHEVKVQKKKRLVRQNLSQELAELAGRLHVSVMGWADGLDSHEASLAPLLATAFRDFLADLKLVFDKSAGLLMAIESRGKAAVEIVRPDVSSLSREMMAGRSWIFTSATLSTSDKFQSRFDHFKRSLGVAHCDEIDVGSPFNYAKQQLYYVPWITLPRRAYSPEREARDFAELAAEHYREVLMVTQGRALLLFTSYLRMQTVYQALRAKYGELPWPVRLQGGDDHEQELIAWFRSTDNAVLFAVTLWEGIDVPGPALACTIMDRFPMAPPDDPILQERQARCGSYHEAAVPRALIKAKQGAGRPVRCETDRGLVVFMDTKLLTDPKLRGCLQQMPGRPGASDSPSRVLRREDLHKIGPWLGSNRKAKLA